MSTPQAIAHRVRSIEGQLRSHESMLEGVQSERERRHILDRINEFRRDLERAKAGKLTANQ